MKPATAKNLERRYQAMQDAKQAWDDAVIAAYNEGNSLNAIGKAAGTSHVQISNILQRLGVRKKWRTIGDANRELEQRQRKTEQDV